TLPARRRCPRAHAAHRPPAARAATRATCAAPPARGDRPARHPADRGYAVRVHPASRRANAPCRRAPHPGRPSTPRSQPATTPHSPPRRVPPDSGRPSAGRNRPPAVPGDLEPGRNRKRMSRYQLPGKVVMSSCMRRTVTLFAGGTALLLAMAALAAPASARPGAVDPPTNLRVTQVDHTSATIAWNASPQADSYLMTWSPAPPPEWMGWVETTSTTATLPVTHPGATHYLTVIAMRGSALASARMRFA